MTTHEPNTEIETQPLTAETKSSTRLFMPFCLPNHYVLFHLKDNFLFHIFFYSEFKICVFFIHICP